jgi:hypothetical protein
MTQDEIIEMAKEAGLSNPLWIENDYEIIETFASLVEAKATAKEREACAKVAEHKFGVIGSTIAIAIRARGEQA